MADDAKVDTSASQIAQGAATPPVVKPAAAEPVKKPFLIKITSKAHGPKGRFVDLTDVEAEDGLKAKVLAVPTPEQLAMRRT